MDGNEEARSRKKLNYSAAELTIIYILRKKSNKTFGSDGKKGGEVEGNICSIEDGDESLRKVFG